MKNYLVVGASSGIGNALSKKLLKRADVSVYCTYKTDYPGSDSDGITWMEYDSLKGEVPFEVIPEKLDGFAYCPGTILLKPVNRITEDELLADYRLNVIGFVKTLQAVLPRLKRSEQASVLVFSTLAVKTGLPYHSIVSASKGAIEGLTSALAAELAPSIRVNCIAPSITDTPLSAGLLNSIEKREAAASRHPLKRIGTPEDIASLADFLLVEAGWITGQIMHVDGGIGVIR